MTGLEVGWPSPSAGAFDFAQALADPTDGLSLFQDLYLPDRPNFDDFAVTTRDLSTDRDAPAAALLPMQSAGQSLAQPIGQSVGQSFVQPLADDDELEEESVLLEAPPILDPIENGPISSSLRALFDSMAASSPMVRYSIAAFAALQVQATGKKVNYQQYYDKAANELSGRFQSTGETLTVSHSELRYVLTTIFFLTYINVRLSNFLDIFYSG